MSGYNLLDRQKNLLRQLVNLAKDGELEGDFLVLSRPDPGESGAYINTIQLESGDSFDFPHSSDLEALCDPGPGLSPLLSYEWNTQRKNKLYRLRQAAFEAVDSDFEAPAALAGTQITIGAIIQGMSGGSIELVGIAQDSQIVQIVNDPALLQSQIEALVEGLLREARPMLKDEALVAYREAAEGLKEELLLREPSPSKIKQLVGFLGFLGDLEATVTLIERVWPILYPLILLAFEIIQRS